MSKIEVTQAYVRCPQGDFGTSVVKECDIKEVCLDTHVPLYFLASFGSSFSNKRGLQMCVFKSFQGCSSRCECGSSRNLGLEHVCWSALRSSMERTRRE